MNVSLMRALLVACSAALIPNIASAYYAAHIGRWTSRDPVAQGLRIGGDISPVPGHVARFVNRGAPPSRAPVVSYPQGGYVDGFNLYNYVHNMPTVALDPSGGLMVCCGDVRGNSCERQFRHCELTNGNLGRVNEKCYPVWQDDDCERALDDGTPCCKATSGQIAACFKRHPYSAGTGQVESNCQQSTVDTIGNCCLKSSFRPNWYANSEGSCKKGYWIVIPGWLPGDPGRRKWVCTERAFPTCNWQSNDPPEDPGDNLPPFGAG